MYSKYPWIPFFKELATSLLKYKDNREPLLKWLREEIAVSKGMDKKEFKYCDTLLDPSRKDIDPFSVISILCKKYHFESVEGILQKYKDFFNIHSEISSTDWGMVTNNTIDFLFLKNEIVIKRLWELFRKVLIGEEASFEYDKLLDEENTHYYLTHILSWICPEKYLALNGPIREYLKKFNISVKEPPRYKQYLNILEQVKNKINNGSIPCTSFLQLTELVQKEGFVAKIWFVPASIEEMESGNLNLETILSEQKKKETNLFYNKVIPKQDIVILYESNNQNRNIHAACFGWGRFKSNEIRLNSKMLSDIEWHLYGENTITWEYSGNNNIFKINSNANILEMLSINKQTTKAHMKQKKYRKYIELLETNKNLILTGAPGTGKTYMAKAIAEEMGAEWEFVQFHPSYDYTDFVEGLRPYTQGSNIGFKRKDGVFKKFCKCALTKNYTSFRSTKNGSHNDNMSFVEKYEWLLKHLKNLQEPLILERPRSDAFEVTIDDNNALKINNIPIKKETFENYYNGTKKGNWYNSHFKKILEYIDKHYSNSLISHSPLTVAKKYVFIIDEINRGEISKIFGELFFSIDPDYRGEKERVRTQYQNMIDDDDVFKDGFFVPENVYIIGTMNDIDRSVESMDFAMRRRFAWKEVTAEESMQMLDGMPNEQALKNRMRNLNNAMLKIQGLGKAYQIGAAYFKKIENYDGDFEKLWEYHLEGLLAEYLRGNQNADKQLQELKKAYENETAKHEETDNNNGQP